MLYGFIFIIINELFEVNFNTRVGFDEHDISIAGSPH